MRVPRARGAADAWTPRAPLFYSPSWTLPLRCPDTTLERVSLRSHEANYTRTAEKPRVTTATRHSDYEACRCGQRMPPNSLRHGTPCHRPAGRVVEAGRTRTGPPTSKGASPGSWEANDGWSATPTWGRKNRRPGRKRWEWTPRHPPARAQHQANPSRSRRLETAQQESRSPGPDRRSPEADDDGGSTS